MQRNARKKQSQRLAVQNLEDRSVPAVTLSYVNDNWHFVSDNDASGSLTAGDTVRNDNDTINPGTITATYGIDGFGTVANGTFSGTVTGSATINDAIANTNIGGTVNVLEGVYGEFVTVSKSLNIKGAQAGVDARSGRLGAAESIIQQNASNQAGFFLNASNVVLDGFIVQNSTNGNFPGAGLLIGAGTSGATVVNNIVQNNIYGISLANSGANQARIQFNLIRNNNQTGPASGHGIYTDQFNAGGTLSNVLIDSNVFAGHSGHAIGFSSTDATKPSTAITISNNVFDGNGRGLYAFNLTNSSITSNTFQNSTEAATADIRLFEGVSGLTISRNVMQNGAGRALRISNIGTGSPNATGVSFTLNSVTGYTGPAGTFQVDAGSHTGALNATSNWWGNITGPTTTANPGGTGATLADPDVVVKFRPWLVYAPDANAALPGVQLPTTVTITAGGDISAADNDFTLLQNAVGTVVSGQTLNLSGDFDWTATHAAAAYAASSAGSATADIRGAKLPGSLTNVTITSAAADAHIRGGGDSADAIFNAFLYADDAASPGTTTGLTIERLNIDDFEAATVFGWNNTGAFNGTRVRDNTVTISGDNGGLSDTQNIAFYFWLGANQQLTGNTVSFQADGTRSVGTGARSFGFQNGTTGGTGYDGLVIADNIFRLLASSGTEIVTGIWENGHNDDNASDIAITGNQFLGRSGDLFDRGLMLTSQTTGLVIDGNTFTDLDNVFFARNASGGTEAGDKFTFTNNALTRVGGADGIFLRNVTDDPTPVTVGINWNINNSVDGETGARGLNELSVQATHAGRPNTAASDLNAVNALGTVTDAFVNDDWGSAGRFTDPDGIGTGLGPIAFGFNTFNTIQAGVSAATAGSTVGVLAGTYAESVAVNKSLTLLGAQNGVNPRAGRTADGPQESIVQATGGMGFSISAANVTVAGFSVTAGVGAGFGIAETVPLVGTTIRDNFVHGFTGALAIAIGGSNFEITGNEVFNNYAGVYLANNASNGTVSGNLIRNHSGTTGTDEGSGVVLEGTNPDIAITGNEITGNRHGIYIWTGFGSDLSGTTVFGNAISGNTVAVKNTNSVVLDASGNWWGTNVAAAVAAAVGSGVDFTPWLDAGTDADAGTGFAGSFANIHVDDAGAQTGSTGRIQEGVDLVTTGGVVNVHAGTYAENVIVNRRMAVGGDGPTTVISPAGGIGFDLTAAGVPVTLFDLSITGAATAIHADGPSEVQLSGLTLTGNSSGGTLTNVGVITLRTDTAGLVDDTITVTPTQFTVQGQDSIAYTGANFLLVRTSAGNDTIIVTPSVDTTIDVDGGANTAPGDQLIVNQNGQGATITPTQVLVPGRKPVHYSNVENVSAPAAVIIDGDLLIGGTNANDSINVSMNSARTNVIVSLNGHAVGTFLLADITGRIIVHSNEGNDLIQIGAIVPVDAVVFAEAGNDRLFGGGGNDYLDGGAGNDSAVGGNGNDTMVGGDGRDTMVGSAGTDTAVGPDAAANWRISGVGSGTVNTTTSFRLVEALTGGTGDDNFRFVGKGAVTGKVDGGAGANTLDYTFIGSGIRANLFAGTAGRTGGVANMDNVIGGAGRDILIGDAGANRLTGNGGRDILIGGGGVDSLVGGNGDDILVAGSTDHDGSNASLENLMNEWKRVVPYSTRVRHLNRTLAGGANGATELTVATVHDDGGAVDSLTGGAGADWFITFAGDATDAAGTETVTAL